MDSKFEIIRFGMPGFDYSLNSFITLSKTSPVYSSKFCDYYQELRNELEDNMSILINVSGTTVLGLLFSAPNNLKNLNHELTYFGLPAALLTLESASAEILNGATNALLQTLNDSGFLVANGRITNPHTLQINPTSLKSNKIERLFFSNEKVTPRFDRVLDLNMTQELLRSEYSKSVRTALKGESISAKITSNRDNLDLVRHEFSVLKKLHRLSAGKLTRSERSWELQFEMVKNGSGLIVSGMQDNEIVTSALFMLNTSSAFYGVSASDYTGNGRGLSHHLIDYAIKVFQDFGIDQIWLGSQHTSLTAQVNDKEKRIEEFKGYFGGSIQTTLISRSGLSYEP